MSDLTPEKAIEIAQAYDQEVERQLSDLRHEGEFQGQLVHDLMKTLDLAESKLEEARSIGGADLEYTDEENVFSIDGLRAMLEFRRADVWIQAGSDGNAVRHLEESIRLAETPTAHAYLGLHFTNKGIKNRAVEHFRRAVELDPGNTEYLKELDRAEHMRRGRLRNRVPDQMIGGVCAELGERFGISRHLLRAGSVVLALLTGGGGILLYLIAWAWLALRRPPDASSNL